MHGSSYTWDMLHLCHPIEKPSYRKMKDKWFFYMKKEGEREREREREREFTHSLQELLCGLCPQSNSWCSTWRWLGTGFQTTYTLEIAADERSRSDTFTKMQVHVQIRIMASWWLQYFEHYALLSLPPDLSLSLSLSLSLPLPLPPSLPLSHYLSLSLSISLLISDPP